MSQSGKKIKELEVMVAETIQEAQDTVTLVLFTGNDQLTYEPEACAGQVGVGSDGVVRWGGGVARYVYVMDADAANPGVPPNLDLPDGTIWRLDVHPDDPAIESGIRYGDEGDGALQTHPVAGTPDALVSGREYYLYVLKDIYQPAERCLFEAP